jgi:hypothetical protein
MNGKITFFDKTSLTYVSPYLEGISALARSYGYEFCLKKDLPDFFQEQDFLVSREFIKSAHFNTSAEVVLNCTGLFRAERAGEQFYFCVDAGDHAVFSREKDKVYYGYNLPLLEKVKYYFKVNYRSDVVLSNSKLNHFSKKIIPLPAVYPSYIRELWRFIPYSLSDWHNDTARSISLRRIKDIYNLARNRSLGIYRAQIKEIDVFFVVNFYPNNKMVEENEFRYELICKLREAKNIKSITGFASNGSLPERYSNAQVARFRMNNYYKVLSRSRIGLYVRGVHECLSFKLGPLFELGLPVIGQKLLSNRDLFYNDPIISEQFNYDTVDEIIRGISYALAQNETLDRWAKHNAWFFDSNMSPKAMSALILRHIVGKD